MYKWRVLTSLVIVLVIWQVAVWNRLVPGAYLPSPVATVGALWQGLMSGELSIAWVQTLVRVLVGIVASSALGIGLAILTARYRLLKQAFDPLAELLRPLPPAALVPISIFFLGLHWKLYAFIVLFACIWPVYLNASMALAAVPQVQLYTAATFGYYGWDRVLRIQLPAALPDIFTGIRTAAAIALIAVIVAEMLAGRDGLGFVLNDAAMTLRIPETFAVLVLLMLSGLALGEVVVGLRNRIVSWNIGMTAANRS